MCCFSRPVKEVARTKLFARASMSGRQFLVYSMVVEADEPLAMILPLPVSATVREDAVRFINLERYADFFEELEEGFPDEYGALRLAGPDDDTSRDRLKVEKVGSFEASFVPAIRDFSRLDERFRMPTALWDKSPKYKRYGFAVFQLLKEHRGLQKIHPMAFEFPRANQKALFFPTVHIHDGAIHRTAEFDHVLYCQQSTAGEDVMMWRESSRPVGMYAEKHRRSEGILHPDRHCYRRELAGELENVDTFV